jgi:hypothetical protein
MLSIIVLGVVKLSDFMPSVIILNVIMLNHNFELCNCVCQLAWSHNAEYPCAEFH